MLSWWLSKSQSIPFEPYQQLLLPATSQEDWWRWHDDIYSTSSLVHSFIHIAFQFIGPSITSYSSTNPSYRVYEVDSRTYEVVNYQTYFFNLTESNNGEGRPKWRLEYEAKTDLLGEDARQALQQFKGDGSPGLPINHHSLHEVLGRLYGRSRTLDNKHGNDPVSASTGLPFSGDQFFFGYYRRYYVQSDLMSLTASLTPDAIKKNTILRDHSVENPFTRVGGPNSLIQPLVSKEE